MSEAPAVPTTLRDGLLLRELLDGLREAVLVYDLDAQLVDHNARARELLALDEASLGRLTLATDPNHPISVLPRLWPAVVDGEDKRVGFRVSSSAEPLELELCTRHISLGGASLVLLEVYDIMARKRSEKALRDSKKQLETAMLVRTRELQAKLMLIEAQRQTLLELSAPVIQVWEDVLVLPLIGEIDEDRAAQVTHNVLAALVRTSSNHVIIDLTGVPEIEETAASAMLRTIQTVRLLGADCSLTGIAPAAAQSLVRRDNDWLNSVQTFADLQAALKVAVRRGV